MRQTKGAIGNLLNRYRAVLKKCHLRNVFGSLAIAALTIGIVSSAQAAQVLIQDQDTSFTPADIINSGDDNCGLRIRATNTNKISVTVDGAQIAGKLWGVTVWPGSRKNDKGEWSYALGTAYERDHVTLTVNGGSKISGQDYGIAGNGSYHGTTININGGEITAEATGIYHPQDGELKISGGTITGGETGIELRSGSLNITGGEITGNGNPFDSDPNGNGTTTVGAALAISQHVTNKTINVIITGGTFTGERAIYEEDLEDSLTDNISIKIENGNFNGEIYSENCDNFITGGTFSDMTPMYYLGENADITVSLAKDYSSSTDYKGHDGNRVGVGAYTVEQSQKVTMLTNGKSFKIESLAIQTGGAMTIDLPDNGGVAPSANKAFLGLGQQLDMADVKKLTVGTPTNTTADVAFGPDSTFVVDGNVASNTAIIKGTNQTLAVDDGSDVYIANAQANTRYILTEGLDHSTGGYWDEANLLANRLITAKILTQDGKVLVDTEVSNVATALPGVIPATALTTMLGTNINNTDSTAMGVRFLSRALEPTYIADDKTTVTTINEVSRAAVMAGVQNTSLRVADAAADTVLHHLSLWNYDSGNSIHQDGVDMWIVPMYGNTYSHGMTTSDAAVHGNFGGIALGADAHLGTVAGGKLRAGLAANLGTGYSWASGTVTDIENSYKFGGVHLYAGWNLDDLNLMATVGYNWTHHDMKMDLPSSMGMGEAEADVYTRAFTADFRAEYQIRTDWVDILPHVGVRYTSLQTDDYDLEVNGGTINTVETDMQHIFQFPVGVSFTKNIAVNDWNLKPQVDVSFIPTAGDHEVYTDIFYSGINATDGVHSRIMDGNSWKGTVGFQAEKGDFALSLNYGIQASAHETNQGVQLNIGYKF